MFDKMLNKTCFNIDKGTVFQLLWIFLYIFLPTFHLIIASMKSEEILEGGG